MKNLSHIKKITALLIAAVMLILTSCDATLVDEEFSTGDEQKVFNLYNETSENVKKSETVYANLDANGNVKLITVSDWLHADRTALYIDDMTTLTSVVATRGNYSSFGKDGSLRWHTDSSDVYYEGTSNNPLPVDISIKYFLDGVETAPADLVGKSGNFTMEVTMKNNVYREVDINGEKVTLYAPLVTVGGMMLSYENFANISVSNGMSVGGGSYEVVVMAAVPGINESLKLNTIDTSAINGFSFSDTFSVSATVTNFSMSDVYFAVSPLSSLNFDFEMPETIEDVKDILAEIKDVQAVLEQIDPENVLLNFMTDTEQVREMLDVMQKGLTVYNENKKMLETMTEILTPENIETLSNFLSSLDKEEMDSLMSLMSNLPALSNVISSLKDLSDGLEEVKPILDSFSAAMEDPEIAASMERLPETLATMSELMTFLNENEELLDVMSALLASEDVNELTDILDQVESGNIDLSNTDLSGLPENSEEIVARMKPWLETDYKIYTTAPDYMETSCTFILKTDPIK